MHVYKWRRSSRVTPGFIRFLYPVNREIYDPYKILCKYYVSLKFLLGSAAIFSEAESDVLREAARTPPRHIGCVCDLSYRLYEFSLENYN